MLPVHNTIVFLEFDGTFADTTRFVFHNVLVVELMRDASEWAQ
jgi:hypothetical protein